MPRRHAVVLLAATVVIAAGCTPATEGDAADDASATAVSPTPTAPPSPGQEVFEQDDRVLEVAVKEPSTLDPMRIQDPGSFLVARQLYEGLTRWDGEEQRVEPAAAVGWRASDRGRNWFFKLREGMSFHDGTPVTAQDFVFAFDRIAQRSNASELAYLLDKIEGFDRVNRRGRGTHMAGLVAIDELTLGVRLTEPFMDLPALLTHPALVPVPQVAVTDLDRFLSAPVGNGPFQIAEEWSPGQPVSLRAFAGFIETPEIDGIRFVPYDDAATSWIPFVRGDLHVAEVPAGQANT